MSEDADSGDVGYESPEARQNYEFATAIIDLRAASEHISQRVGPFTLNASRRAVVATADALIVGLVASTTASAFIHLLEGERFLAFRIRRYTNRYRRAGRIAILLNILGALYYFTTPPSSIFEVFDFAVSAKPAIIVVSLAIPTAHVLTLGIRDLRGRGPYRRVARAAIDISGRVRASHRRYAESRAAADETREERRR
jgi:hypothetical protein